MYLRHNFLLAAAAWRTRCLVSRELRSDVYTRRIILVVWDGRVRTDRRVVHGRYVSVGGTQVTAVVSSLWDVRVSENIRWRRLNVPTRSTLATGVHCDVCSRYISVGEPQVTPSQLSEQGDADHWCSPHRTVPTPTFWHADPPVGQVAKPVIRQLSPTLFWLLIDVTKSTVVSRLDSCRFSTFRCKCYSFACIPALPR